MKKRYLLPLFLLPFMVAGCSSEAYTPKLPIPTVPADDPGGGGGGGGGGGSEEEWGEENMTVYFYLDYSHSDEPITTLRWWALRPLGEEGDPYKNIPEVAKPANLVAADPLYPTCLGYSEYPSAIDSSKLWNFATDYKQSNTLNLYGIWVSAS